MGEVRPVVTVSTTAYVSCMDRECEDGHEFPEVDEGRSSVREIALEPWCTACESYGCVPGEVDADGVACAPSLVADAVREIGRQYVTDVDLIVTGLGLELQCWAHETVYDVGYAYEVDRSVSVQGFTDKQVREVFAALKKEGK